jgi:diguanylate cyclase (GGDEF)-like protein/PAS domain S-box-containing protein
MPAGFFQINEGLRNKNKVFGSKHNRLYNRGMAQYIVFLILAAITLLLNWLVILFAWKYRKIRGAEELIACMLAASGWIFFNSMEVLSPLGISTYTWATLTYIFIPLVPLSWLIFWLTFSGLNRWLQPNRLFWLFLIPLITILISQTNTFNHLLWQFYTIETIGNFHRLQPISYGIGFYLNWFYSLTLCMTCIFITVREYFTNNLIYRRRYGMILATTIFPMLINIFYVLKPIPEITKDFTPIAFGVSEFILFFTIFRFGLFDLMPVARSALVEQSLDGMVVVNIDEIIVDINPRAETIFNGGKEQVIGTNITTFLPFWKEMVNSPPGQVIETQFSNLSEERYFEVRLSPLNSEMDSPIAWLVTMNDVTSHRQLMKELEISAATDSLTGLNNRRHFFILMEKESQLAHQKKQPISLALLDIDNLKNINDQYGHQTGDKLLQEVGEHIKNCLRSSDVVARFGGDEFVILMPHTEKTAAMAVAERIRSNISTLEFTTKDTTSKTSVSIGVSSVPAGKSIDIDSFVEKADQAMYKAKKTGRNRVVAL